MTTEIDDLEREIQRTRERLDIKTHRLKMLTGETSKCAHSAMKLSFGLARCMECGDNFDVVFTNGEPSRTKLTSLAGAGNTILIGVFDRLIEAKREET